MYISANVTIRRGTGCPYYIFNKHMFSLHSWKTLHSWVVPEPRRRSTVTSALEEAVQLSIVNDESEAVRNRRWRESGGRLRYRFSRRAPPDEPRATRSLRIGSTLGFPLLLTIYQGWKRFSWDWGSKTATHSDLTIHCRCLSNGKCGRVRAKGQPL